MKTVQTSKNIRQIFECMGISLIISNEIDYVDIGQEPDIISYLPLNRLERIKNNNLDPWKNLRSESRIGKFFTKHFAFDEKVIENIVNKYKTFYNFFLKNGDGVFEIVEGDDIAYWYDMKRYKPGGGTLNGSCMRGQPETRFKLYTDNPKNIKLVILKEDDLLIGRCLMWIDDHGKVYMDRPYTRYDEDVFLYKLFAEKKGYFHYFDRMTTPSCRDFSLTIKRGTATNPPYLDSMRINRNKVTLNM
jgi:hypothetical protein